MMSFSIGVKERGSPALREAEVAERRAAQLDEAGIAPMARIGKIDGDVGDDARRARPEDDDALARNSASSTSCVTRSAVNPLRCQRHEFVLHGEAGQRIELAERLVEEEELRIVHEGAGQRHALGHAAGELVRIGGGEAVEPDEPDDVVDAPPRVLGSAPRFRPRATLSRTVRHG